MNKKRCNTLLPLVQLLPAVAAAAAVLFALPRTVPVLAAVPKKLTAVVEQPVEAASVEAEEEALPKLPYADGVYVGVIIRRHQVNCFRYWIKAVACRFNVFDVFSAVCASAFRTFGKRSAKPF